MNFTPPPPSQSSHAVRRHCTAESQWRVAEIKSWFLSRRPTDQQACDRVSKGRRDPTHWLDPMTQRQPAEKCDEPGCLNSTPSYEWLPLLLLTHYYYYYRLYTIAVVVDPSRGRVGDGLSLINSGRCWLIVELPCVHLRGTKMRSI